MKPFRGDFRASRLSHLNSKKTLSRLRHLPLEKVLNLNRVVPHVPGAGPDQKSRLNALKLDRVVEEIDLIHTISTLHASSVMYPLADAVEVDLQLA
jgi:hypothetical protein